MFLSPLSAVFLDKWVFCQCFITVTMFLSFVTGYVLLGENSINKYRVLLCRLSFVELGLLSGVAAILRFPIADPEDDDDDSSSDGGE